MSRGPFCVKGWPCGSKEIQGETKKKVCDFFFGFCGFGLGTVNNKDGQVVLHCSLSLITSSLIITTMGVTKTTLIPGDGKTFPKVGQTVVMHCKLRVVFRTGMQKINATNTNDWDGRRH